MGNGRRDAAAAARARQAPGQGPDVHRPQADRRGGPRPPGWCPASSKPASSTTSSPTSPHHRQGLGRGRCATPSGASIRAVELDPRGALAVELLAIEEKPRAGRARGTWRKPMAGLRARHRKARHDLATDDALRIVAERAETQGDAQALVTTTARLSYRCTARRRASRRQGHAGDGRRPRRSSRHPHGQRRELGDAVLRRSADRRRHRAGQHALQVGRARLLPAAGGRARCCSPSIAF